MKVRNEYAELCSILVKIGIKYGLVMSSLKRVFAKMGTQSSALLVSFADLMYFIHL